jgi:hypothetical protein
MIVMLLELAAPVAACHLRPDADVLLGSRALRTGDVLEPGCVANDIVLAELPSDDVQWKTDALVTLLRRRIPGIVVEVPAEVAASVRLRAVSAPEGVPAHSMSRETTADVPAGAVISLANTRASHCARKGGGKVRYDPAAAAPRASAFLEAGTCLGAIAVDDRKRIAPGDEVTLQIRLGSVSVEKTLIAVQPAIAGAPVFAADDAGVILRVPANRDVR